jgi:hypothetical protein
MPTFCVALFADDVDASIKAIVHDFRAHGLPLPFWGGVHRGPHEPKRQRREVVHDDVRPLGSVQAPTAS